MVHTREPCTLTDAKPEQSGRGVESGGVQDPWYGVRDSPRDSGADFVCTVPEAQLYLDFQRQQMTLLKAAKSGLRNTCVFNARLQRNVNRPQLPHEPPK